MENDGEMREELGDLLLQVIFHCQLAHERKAFDFDTVCNELADKLVRRHPHVFGDKTIRRCQKGLDSMGGHQTIRKERNPRRRHSALDGIPRHLPALQYAEKWLKKARKVAPLSNHLQAPSLPESADQFAEALLDQVIAAQAKGWSPEIPAEGGAPTTRANLEGSGSKPLMNPINDCPAIGSPSLSIMSIVRRLDHTRYRVTDLEKER